MQINIKAKYSNFADVVENLTPESKNALKTAAIGLYGDYWELTLGELFKLDAGDYGIIDLRDDETIAQHIWLEGLAEFGKEFAKIAKSLQIPKSLYRKYEEQARSVCLKVSAQESMLVFARKYFGLKSFGEAEKVTLADYVIARRDEYNQTVMQRRCEQLQAAELRNKRTRK